MSRIVNGWNYVGSLPVTLFIVANSKECIITTRNSATKSNALHRVQCVIRILRHVIRSVFPSRKYWFLVSNSLAFPGAYHYHSLIRPRHTVTSTSSLLQDSIFVNILYIIYRVFRNSLDMQHFSSRQDGHTFYNSLLTWA